MATACAALGQAAEGDPVHGADLYGRFCSPCHGTHGMGGGGYRGGFTPHVRVFSDKKYMESLPDEYLVLVTKIGGAAVGKSSQMPAWEKRLNEEQIREIIAHIRKLK